MLNFKRWVEDSQEPEKQYIKQIRYILDLPLGFFKGSNPYETLKEAYEKQLQQNPSEAEKLKNAYVKMWQELDRRFGGRTFNEFFSDVSSGDERYKPGAEFKPELDLSEQKEFEEAKVNYLGNFDAHIRTSIPTYHEIHTRKGSAIIKAFGNLDIKLLDIGGSEGSWARTITHLTHGNIKTDILDPNEQMYQFYKSKGETPGSRFIVAAFLQGWMQDDGTLIQSFNHQTVQQRYDIINESMTFQFIGPHRDSHIAEIKKLLNPNGLFLTEEKLKTDPQSWKINEELKDKEHKNKYYTSEMLKQKDKVVAFSAEKQDKKQTPWPQDDEEAEVVGMVNNMSKVEDFERILKSNFSSVWQYWDSGNFKGYAASDNPQMVSQFLSALGNVQTRFSTTKLPREVNLIQGESFMAKKFIEWLKEADK
jgi:ubiquinone/menaquinone biosynthesis C-methylase UbiE